MKFFLNIQQFSVMDEKGKKKRREKKKKR